METYKIRDKAPDPAEFWKRVQSRSKLKDLQIKLGYPPNSNAFPMYKQRGTIPSYDKVRAIADILDVSVEFLLYGVDPPNYDNLNPAEKKILKLMRTDMSFLSEVSSLYVKYTEKNS